jgi:anti-sigma factor RsiW
MSQSNRSEGARPTPQQFAAYVDGELGPADRAVVDAWLGGHPEARDDVGGQRRLLRQWHAAAPPGPDEAAWAGSLARVEAGLERAARQRAASRPLAVVGRLGVAVGAAAAVMVLALGLGRLVVPGPVPAPLPVATTDDVEILSIEGGDVGALVVGKLPVQGPLNLASADDVKVDKTGSDVQVSKTPEAPHGQLPGPMIIPSDPSRNVVP